mgnify:FL=1
MDKLGRRLREAREARGSTLEDAEAATRIRAQFLESLEAGDFAAFPGSDVQVRGFLRIYARYLDLSPRDVLARYSAEVHGVEQTMGDEAPNSFGADPVEPPKDLTTIRFRPRDIPVAASLPRWMNVRTVIIVGMVLIVLLGVLALVTYVLNQPQGESLLAPLHRTVPTQVARAATATAAPGEPTPTFPVSSSGELTMDLEATEHVQVRVRQGGELVFQETMAPGQTQSWSDDELIIVETGNGAALLVSVNGVPLGTVCGRGELCTRAWGPNGEVTSP